MKHEKFLSADTTESALAALDRAGRYGLSAQTLGDAVVRDCACGYVESDEREALGLQIGAALCAFERWQRGGRSRFRGFDTVDRLAYTATTNEATVCHWCSCECRRSLRRIAPT